MIRRLVLTHKAQGIVGTDGKDRGAAHVCRLINHAVDVKVVGVVVGVVIVALAHVGIVGRSHHVAGTVIRDAKYGG